MSPAVHLLTRALFVATSLLVLVGCGSSTTATNPAPTRSASADPITVSNCGQQVTLTSKPERVFLIGADAVPLVAAVGALGTVVARAGDFPDGVYEPTVQQQVDAIPKLDAKKGATGGVVISTETILAQRPDLVIGPDNAVDPSALAGAGIALYTPPAYCPDGSPGTVQGTASFDWVYDQVREYGQLFGAPDAAAAENDRLRQQVATLSTAAPGGSRTAVALYVPEGGGTLYPYGAPSMMTPLLQAAGYANVYADNPQRVFEVNREDLLARNPDVIVLLYSAGTEASVRQNFRGIKGLSSLKAVRDDRLVVLPFAFTDPPTPASVEGARVLARKLSS